MAQPSGLRCIGKYDLEDCSIKAHSHAEGKGAKIA